MQKAMVGFLLALVVLAPLSQAQWIDDDDNDAAQGFGPASDVEHGRPGVAEIHAVDIEEAESTIEITVEHAAHPQPTAPLMDSARFDIWFQHGEAPYHISVYYGQALAESEHNYDGDLYEDRWDFLHALDIEAVDSGFKIVLEKAWIPDQYGQKPTKGSTLNEFYIESLSSQGGGVILICLTDCKPDGPWAEDQAPNSEVRGTFDFQYGIGQEGDIRLHSPAPVRWSNGAATTFVYEVMAVNQGDEQDQLVFALSGIPDTWQVAPIPVVDLMPGESRAIPVAVKVPFSHEHGSDPRFLVEARGAFGVGRIELGVHYPLIPQPTGHHSSMYLHTRNVEANFEQATIEGLVGANHGTLAYMNAAEEHDADENIRVGGSKGSTIGGELDVIVDGQVPDYGMVYEWAIPLSPGLRVGLQTNENTTTAGEIHMEFDHAIGEINLYGRLAVIDGEELDTGFNFDPEVGEQLAWFESTATTPVANSVIVPVTMQGERKTILFDEHNELVLYLNAHIVRPDAPLSPNTGVYLTGGKIDLPLEEHHDVVPVNVEFPEKVQQDAIDSISGASMEETKESPSVGPFAFLASIGLALLCRRMA